MNSAKFYNDYEKLKTVGQGAFGTATLYKRKKDNKCVVIKEVLLMNMDYIEKRSALNEVEILATLNNQNIIKYFGSFQKEGALIIIMEYADGGNLAQLINAKKNKNEIFTEKSILNILSQMTAALDYMHSNKILHRDLKTANIFLNLNGNIKVGDFGISKILNTRSQAQTVVGTPYYLSPEMCEGCDYNEKSDIWALGCILYELACLRKPFEAHTLPVLVRKILICQYEDIPSIYSYDLSKLIKRILQKNPILRPSAKYIANTIIPKIVNKRFDVSSDDSFKIGAPCERSILYKMFNIDGCQKVTPVELPPYKKIIDFSIGHSHQIVITSDNVVYTWGNNNFGQLGSNDQLPKPFAAVTKYFQGQQIVRCIAGKNFSLFLDKKGLLYSCGYGKDGCLGHGDWTNIFLPKLIEALRYISIVQICAGLEHVVALTSGGKVYTWGCSKFGQLGQGHTHVRCIPLAIKFPHSIKIKNIFCGNNESVILSTTGEVFACGSNNFYKLGNFTLEILTQFTQITRIKDRIKFVSIGINHAAFLTENGTVITLGKNPQKLLKPQINKFQNKITMIGCGLNFTVAADSRNVIWLWGSFYKNLKSTVKFKETSNVAPIKPGSNSPIVLQDVVVHDSIEHIMAPRSILALFSSNENLKIGNTIQLGSIKVKDNNLYVMIHTKSPPPIQQFTSNKIYQTLKSLIGDDEEQ